MNQMIINNQNNIYCMWYYYYECNNFISITYIFYLLMYILSHTYSNLKVINNSNIYQNIFNTPYFHL